MEEDIKKLELYIRFVLRAIPKHTSADNSNYEIANILENLIARYKEQLVKNKELTEGWQKDTRRIIDTVFKDEYIKKSKVKEKIENKISYCRLEQIEGETTEGKNGLHKKYWEMYEDLLEKLKKQLLEES